MLELIRELKKYGQVTTFGSILEKNLSEINDIDIAVIFDDESSYDPGLLINNICKKNKIDEYCRVQKLFAYKKVPSETKKALPIHILYCKKQDLQKQHPILESLKKGLVMEYSNAEC